MKREKYINNTGEYQKLMVPIRISQRNKNQFLPYTSEPQIQIVSGFLEHSEQTRDPKTCRRGSLSTR